MVSDRVKVFMQQALDTMNDSRHAASNSASAFGAAGDAAFAPLYEVLRSALDKQGIQLPVLGQ